MIEIFIIDLIFLFVLNLSSGLPMHFKGDGK